MRGRASTSAEKKRPATVHQHFGAHQHAKHLGHVKRMIAAAREASEPGKAVQAITKIGRMPIMVAELRELAENGMAALRKAGAVTQDGKRVVSGPGENAFGAENSNLTDVDHLPSLKKQAADLKSGGPRYPAPRCRLRMACPSRPAEYLWAGDHTAMRAPLGLGLGVAFFLRQSAYL